MNPPRQSKIIFARHVMRTVRPHPITSKLREGVKPRTSEAQENLLEMKIVSQREAASLGRELAEANPPRLPPNSCQDY
jgi:hypothetical protein